MTARPLAILEAPSVLGLFSGGVEKLSGSLLAAGLDVRLGALRAGRVEPPLFEPERDPTTRVLNARGLVRYAVALADAVGKVLDDGSFPVVLGGDCSILLGPLLALRRRDRFGLLFLDGHADFYQPEAEPAGEAASMDLALVTGRGPASLVDLEGRAPLVRDEDVVLFGRRDAADAEAHDSQRVEDTGIELLDLAAVRALGAGAAAARALARLADEALAGFWIHLDVDVLDDAIMPAVDYRLPGGLGWDELVTTLRTSLASGRAVGIDVTIFNPTLDPGGGIAARLVDALVAGLGGGATPPRTARAPTDPPAATP